MLKSVTASNLPSPVGPYSPGIAFGELVFVSGQSGREPGTGHVAPDVETQTEQALRNVQAILEAAGSDLAHVIRCGVFLIDMAEFPKMNAVYARMFGGHRPARTTVQVAGLPGPGLRVEIDAVAQHGHTETRKDTEGTEEHGHTETRKDTATRKHGRTRKARKYTEKRVAGER